MVTELKKHFLSKKQLIDLLGVDENNLDRLIERGLPYIKLGKVVRIFFEPSVIAWLKGQEIKKKGDRITD